MVSNYHHFLILCLLFSISISSNAIKALNKSFTIDLIHRDSPQSPFFNPSETPSQRWMNAFERSIDQAKSQENFNKSSTIFANAGYYLLEFTIGTPPSRVLALADTGSDLVWIQCQPCSSCYPQTLPIFQPTTSNTYKNLPCSDQCKTVYTNKFCNPRDNLCHYSVEYGGGSHTEGNVATDTLTLASTGGPVSFPSMVFGCGNNNSGFDRNGTGIVGLGGGPESLISQISNSIDGKFSYCLVPVNSPAKGKMSFGSDAVVSGDGAVTTPLVSGKNLPVTFYFTTLQAISVGNQRFEFVGGGNIDGNMIVDSGTMLTMLPKPFYDKIALEVEKEMKLERQVDEFGSLCYITESDDFYFPVVTVHFKGEDVKLVDKRNIFLRVESDVICFAFHDAQGTAIYGSVQQSNFVMGYDRLAQTLSFKPADCANL
ncbi:hypothetical protein UlMin_038218 [Ulmus minor]